MLLAIPPANKVLTRRPVPSASRLLTVRRVALPMPKMPSCTAVKVVFELLKAAVYRRRPTALLSAVIRFPSRGRALKRP